MVHLCGCIILNMVCITCRRKRWPSDSWGNFLGKRPCPPGISGSWGSSWEIVGPHLPSTQRLNLWLPANEIIWKSTGWKTLGLFGVMAKRCKKQQWKTQRYKNTEATSRHRLVSALASASSLVLWLGLEMGDPMAIHELIRVAYGESLEYLSISFNVDILDILYIFCILFSSNSAFDPSGLRFWLRHLEVPVSWRNVNSGFVVRPWGRPPPGKIATKMIEIGSLLPLSSPVVYRELDIWTIFVPYGRIWLNVWPVSWSKWRAWLIMAQNLPWCWPAPSNLFQFDLCPRGDMICEVGIPGQLGGFTP